MQDASPRNQGSFRPPHPLALLLIRRLPREARVLDFATGSGRDADALRGAGFHLVALDDATAASAEPFSALGAQRFDAAISTHGFLHGSAAAVAERVRSVASRLEPRGLLVATFGSTHDRRFRQGTRIDAATYAPLEGDERGVPHAFFDHAAVVTTLEAAVEIESLEERAVDEIAGRWAHRDRPLERAVHWFAVSSAWGKSLAAR